MVCLRPQLVLDELLPLAQRLIEAAKNGHMTHLRYELLRKILTRCVRCSLHCETPRDACHYPRYNMLSGVELAIVIYRT